MGRRQVAEAACPFRPFAQFLFQHFDASQQFDAVFVAHVVGAVLDYVAGGRVAIVVIAVNITLGRLVESSDDAIDDVVDVDETAAAAMVEVLD